MFGFTWVLDTDRDLRHGRGLSGAPVAPPGPPPPASGPVIALRLQRSGKLSYKILQTGTFGEGCVSRQLIYLNGDIFHSAVSSDLR